MAHLEPIVAAEVIWERLREVISNTKCEMGQVVPEGAFGYSAKEPPPLNLLMYKYNFNVALSFSIFLLVSKLPLLPLSHRFHTPTNI